MKHLTCVIFIVLTMTASLQAQENVALGKPYTLFPRPNYVYCTDPEDNKQLTDGQYTVGYFWTQQSTVGWTNARPAIITVDLGAVQPIRGVSYNTAAGVAGVEFPLAITVLVSDDGKNFYVAGELVRLSAKHGVPPRTGYAVHCYRTEELRTHGRYVTFLVSTSGPYCFVDEVEVFKGEADWLKLPFEGEAITDAKAYFQNVEVHLAIERRIRDDARAVREAAEKANIAADLKRKMVEELDAIIAQASRLPNKHEENFRAVLPLNPLHERVFQVQAMRWRALQLAPLTVWQSGLWDPLLPTQTPSIGAGASVHVAMMLNEYRAGAFNVSNASERAVSLRLQTVGLPGGVNPSYVTVHEVVWTDTRSGTPVAAALPEAKRDAHGFIVNVPSGMTRQVWLTFHPTNVPPGVHKGNIILSQTDSSRHETLKVPLTLHLYPLRFPDAPTLHVGGWDYTNTDSHYEITPQNRAAVIAHLREHFVDSPWATAVVLPPGRYDAEGNMIAPPDTEQFDRWLNRWRGARQYCVFAAVGKRFDRSEMGTPLFNKKVGAWISFWAQHAQRGGVKPQQLVLLLVDEPHRTEQDEIILAWAKAIRAANTGVKVWEDPRHDDPASANQEMMAACDVLCPNRVAFLQAEESYRDYFVRQREGGRELAFYSCKGPTRLLDPYAYYRLQAWSCWLYGAKASYFWAFGDAGGGSSWNEYAAPRAAYVPFFLDATSVTPGKHMEALREGVEDYEYLVMLRDRIAEAERAGVKSKALENAKRILAEAASRVCNAPGANGFLWAQEKDRAVADKVRVEILEALVALR